MKLHHKLAFFTLFLLNYNYQIIAQTCTYDTVYHYQLQGSLYTKTPFSRTIYQRNIDKLPTSIIYQNWDNISSLYKNSIKEDYNYHNTFTTKTSKIQHFIFNPISNAWDNEFLSQKDYNSSGKITLDQYFDWDLTLGNWKLKREYILTYNNSNLLITEIYRTIDLTSGTVVNSTKNEMSYDANNNLIEKIHFNWIITSGNWELYRKEIYTYSATNKQLSYENLYWTTTASWTGFYKSLSSYNSSDILVETINQNYETTSSSYVNSSKIQNLINSFNAIKTIYNFNWDLFKSKWDSTMWSEIHYNGLKQLDTIYSYLRNPTYNLWDKYGKTFYKYQINGKLTETFIQDWVNSLNDWRTTRTNYLTYNSNDSLTSDRSFIYSSSLNRLTEFSWLLHYYNTSNPVKITESFSDFNSSTLIYNTANRYEYMCNSALTNIKNVENDKTIVVFPNPSQNGFIEIKNNIGNNIFQILNPLGQVVMNGKLSTNEKINISKLKSGVYYILIDSKSQSFIIE